MSGVEAAMSKIRVLVVDDHTIVREGIRLLLEGSPDIEVVGEAAEGKAALSEVRTLQPDVVLMDITMPGMSGLEATRQIKAQWPEVQVLALTMHENEEYFFQILHAGASGYVLKGASSAELLSAIRAAARGDVFLHPSLARKLVGDYLRRVGVGEEQPSFDRLTPREKEVLTLIAEGYTNREIAERLVISPSTVQTHRARIMEKLNLQNRTELIKYAIRRGLIDLDS
jgi:two-component system response regulator NreC